MNKFTSRTSIKYYVGIVVILILLLLKKCIGEGNAVNRSSSDIEKFTSETYYFVPPNATFIAAINLANVLPEINFETLRTSKRYIDSLRNYYFENPPLASIFADPKGCGIDIEKKAIFYLDVGDKKLDVYSATVYKLSDKIKFEALIKKTVRAKVEMKKGFQQVVMNDHIAIAWNDKIAFFLNNNPGFDVGSIFSEVMNVSSEKVFDKNPKYRSIMEESKADLSFWFDLTSYARNQLHATGKPGEVSKYILEENKIWGDADFGIGEINLDINFELNKILTEFLSKSFNPDFDTLSSKFIHLDKKPSFIGNVSLNINGLMQLLLKDIDTKVEARKSLAEYGLLIEDFDKAFTGDMLMVTYPNDTTIKSSIVSAFKIRDKSHFFKVIDIMTDVGELEVEGGGLYKMVNTRYIPFFPIFSSYGDNRHRMLVKGDYMYTSIDSNLIKGIQDGNGNNQITYDGMPTDNNNLLYLAGNEKFDKLESLSNQLSIKNYKVNFDGKKLKVKLSLLDSEKPALKQILKLY